MKLLLQRLFLLSLLLVATPALAQLPDADGDGVPDADDACPNIDASGFDVDGDGCIDETANARHVEYWAIEDFPLVYVVHEDGAPGGMGLEQAEIEAGFDAWTELVGVEITASFGGQTTDPVGNGLDGINTVSFEDPDFVALYGNTVLAVGVTTSFTAATDFDGRLARPGQIVDADMLFNPNRTFSIPGAGTVGPDLRSVVTHEAGHLFGLNHSAVVDATMFPALPSGIAGRSLEIDDQVLAFMAYPEAAALAGATRVSGVVTDGGSSTPVPGAAVFAVDPVTEQPVAAQFTLPDGSWSFAGLPAGSYDFFVHPLDGTAGVNGVVPGFINDLVVATAQTLFLPEYYSLDESTFDDRENRDSVTLVEGTAVTGIDVITNVDASAPLVVGTSPTPGQTTVKADGVIVIRYDEAVDFDSVPSRFALERIEGSTRTGVAGQLTALGTRDVLVFTPTGRLAFDADYELKLSAGITDRFGNATVSDYTTAFTTESKPPLSISSIDPVFLVEGTIAVVSGAGFDDTSAANNVVEFAGVSVAASQATFNRLVVTVPPGIPLSPFDVTVRVGNENALVPGGAQGIEVTEFARGTIFDTTPLSNVPSALAVLPDGDWALAATEYGVEARMIDGSDIAFGSLRDTEIIGGLDDIAIVASGRRAYGVSTTGASLHVIDTDDGGDASNPLPSFLTVEVDLATGATPLGVAIDPAGRRAYVPTSEGTIQVWDLVPTSDTFHQQIGEFDSQRGGLVGALAFDRFATHLFALCPGELLAFDLATGQITATVGIGNRPSGIATAPEGGQLYVTDRDGRIDVISSTAFTRVQTIQGEGLLRGVAVSPAGGLGYAANRQDDTISVFDLRVGSATFRTLVAEIPVAGDPVDVVVSPDGGQLFVVGQGESVLQTIGIGFGPVINSVYPHFAKPGDMLAFGGEGFTLTDSVQTTSTGFSYALFDDVTVGPGSGDIGADARYMWARIPQGFTGGPIRNSSDTSPSPTSPGRLDSNPVFTRIFDDATVGDTFRSLNTATTRGDTEFDWGGSSVGLTLTVSPTGEYALLDLGDYLEVLDIDTNSPTFLQSLGRITTNGEFGQDRAFTPDGSLIYTRVGNEVNFWDMRLGQPTFGQKLGVVDWSQLSGVEQFGGLGAISVSPHGQHLLVFANLYEGFVFVPLSGISANQAIATTISGSGDLASKIVHHPAGTWAYVNQQFSSGIEVICVDPNRAEYLTSPLIVFPSSSGEVQDFAVSPDGRRLFAVTRVGGLGGQWELNVFSLDDPGLPVDLGSELLEASGPTSEASISLHPNGQTAVVVIPERRIVQIDVRYAYDYPEVVTDAGLFDEISTMRSLGLFFYNTLFSPAGDILLGVEQTDTVVQVYDYASGSSIGAVVTSGDNQTGVAGKRLPAPIRATPISEGGLAQPGALVEVRVVGGGGFLENGLDRITLVADDEGKVEVEWTLGPDPDVDPTTPQNVLEFGRFVGSGVRVTARSVVEPTAIPLALSQILPLSGSAPVGVTTAVQAQFSRAIDRGTVHGGGVVLRESVSGALVTTALGFADGDRRVSLIPVQALDYERSYTVEVASTVSDLDGNALGVATTRDFTTTAAPAPALGSISPVGATVGTEVVLAGSGFDAVAANNVVNFNGQGITPTAAAVNTLRFLVPTAATTGPVTVTTNGQTTNPITLTVLQPVVVPLDEVTGTVDLGLTTQALAVLPDGTKGYSVSGATDQVIPIDLLTLSDQDPISVGDLPVAAASGPNGLRVYVANFNSQSVSVIDTATDTVIDTIALPAAPTEVVVSPAGDRVYVITPDDLSIQVIDTEIGSATANTVLTTVRTTSNTRGASISPDGTRLYLGTSEGFIVVELGPSNFGVLTTVRKTSNTRGTSITPDGNILFLFAEDGLITVVDVSQNSSFGVITTVRTTSNTKGASISPDGGLLYLILEDSDEVLVYSIEVVGSVSVLEEGLQLLQVNLQSVTTIDAGDDPSWIAFDPRDPNVTFIGSSGDRNIAVLGRSNPADGIAGVLDLKLNEFEGPDGLRYVRACVELPAPYLATDVDLLSLRLGATVQAVPGRGLTIGDDDGDGIADVCFDFNRSDVQQVLPVGDAVKACVTGTVGGLPFEACQTVKNVRPEITNPEEGDELMGGQFVQVRWITPPNSKIDEVLVYLSPTGGFGDAIQISPSLTDDGEWFWKVPDTFTQEARIAVVLLSKKVVCGVTVGENFGINAPPVAVSMQGVTLQAVNGDGVLQWKTPQLARGFGGFRVLRSEEGNSLAEVGRLESGVAVPRDGQLEFSFVDQSVVANTEYSYFLEEFTEEGAGGHRHGPYELEFAVSNGLEQNVPNSFNPRTTIQFGVAKEAPTRLIVFDLRGRRVTTLVNEVLRPDVYTVVWDGKDDRGQQVSSGVYLYRLETDGFAATKKMLLVR